MNSFTAHELDRDNVNLSDLIGLLLLGCTF